MTDRFVTRFDGIEAWSKLPAEQQAVIGALALELIVACHGEDTCDLHEVCPYEASRTLIERQLQEIVSDAMADQVEAWAKSGTPVPSALGKVCRDCGCSHFDPCEEGCWWATDDLCTTCANKRKWAEVEAQR